MAEIYQIDNLDRDILHALMANARTPYAELAKNLPSVPVRSMSGRENEAGGYHHRHPGGYQ